MEESELVSIKNIKRQKLSKVDNNHDININSSKMNKKQYNLRKVVGIQRETDYIYDSNIQI